MKLHFHKENKKKGAQREMEIDKLIERDGFGGFKAVENVQALASKNLDEIPSRYLRPEAEVLLDVVSAEDFSHQIPVIDMTKLVDQHELSKLHFACKEWGFFQV